MRYIREIANPLNIARFGDVGPGGLGSFDTDIYEEIEGELPENWVLAREKPLIEKITALIRGNLTKSMELKIGPYMYNIRMYLEDGLFDDAIEMIDALENAYDVDTNPTEHNGIEALRAEIKTIITKEKLKNGM